MITKELKTKIIAQHQVHKTDVGSIPVQAAVLTERIKQLTEHLKLNKHDNHSRRGLLQMVGRRKRLMTYVQKKDHAVYQALVAKLGLRK